MDHSLTSIHTFLKLYIKCYTKSLAANNIYFGDFKNVDAKFLRGIYFSLYPMKILKEISKQSLQFTVLYFLI